MIYLKNIALSIVGYFVIALLFEITDNVIEACYEVQKWQEYTVFIAWCVYILTKIGSETVRGQNEA